MATFHCLQLRLKGKDAWPIAFSTLKRDKCAQPLVTRYHSVLRPLKINVIPSVTTKYPLDNLFTQ